MQVRDVAVRHTDDCFRWSLPFNQEYDSATINIFQGQFVRLLRQWKYFSEVF